MFVKTRYGGKLALEPRKLWELKPMQTGPLKHILLNLDRDLEGTNNLSSRRDFRTFFALFKLVFISVPQV